MENNTITPNPEPKPQPVAPMPVFGSAVPTPTVTPEAPATPSTSAMPVMSAQPTSSPTSTLPDTTPAPAASIAAEAAQAPVAAPAAPAAPIPATTAPSPISTDPAPTAAAPTPAPAVPAPDPTPTPTPTTQTTSTTPATPASTTPTPTAPISTKTQPPINKGRLIALIAIIAGLLVAGIIAAVLIVIFVSQPNPSASADTALANLKSPDAAPTGITGSVELVNNDDVIASASAVLEGSNLFFNYDGISDVLESYLGLASVADQDSVASLVMISSLLQFAESTWWQIPVEDLTLAAEYRAHPFLVLASVKNNEYHLKIDGDQLADFLGTFDIDFAETNCIDGAYGTNCGSDTDFIGLTSTPTLEQFKKTIEAIDIIATIDSQNRFTSFYAAIGEDDLVVAINLGLNYVDASLSPEEYRPITELMSQFLETIGY